MSQLQYTNSITLVSTKEYHLMLERTESCRLLSHRTPNTIINDQHVFTKISHRCWNISELITYCSSEAVFYCLR